MSIASHRGKRGLRPLHGRVLGALLIALGASVCHQVSEIRLSLPLACVDTVAPGVPASLRTFYVDAGTGNDAANGLSPSTAWRTLDKANQTVQPGDLVLLKGTFLNQTIRPARSGTATARIVYRVAPGASAVLDGAAASVGATVWLDDLSYIVLDGLEIRNTPYGVVSNGNATFIWLRNLQLHDVGSAVNLIGSSDNRLEDSNIQRCGDAPSNTGDCIWIANGSNRNVVVRNIMAYGGHGLIGIGGDQTGMQPSRDNVVALNDLANPWAGGLSFIGYARRTIAECNRLHSMSTSGINYPRAGTQISADSNILRYNEIFGNTADGMQLQGYTYNGLVENVRGNQVYNNTVWGNGGAALQLFQGDVGQVANNLIENNIFWGNNTSSDPNTNRSYNGSYWDIWTDLYHANSDWAAGSLNGNILRNNILAKDAADIGQGWVIIIPPSGNNRYYTMAQAQATFPTVGSNLQADPLFVNAVGSDFRLQTTSPAINAGLIVDSGQPYLGTGPDLGAHELR